MNPNPQNGCRLISHLGAESIRFQQYQSKQFRFSFTFTLLFLRISV